MVNQRLKQQFGNYRLLRLLGQGGFSEVYLGEHIYLKTQAAIKILKMHLERDEFQHFLQEARIFAHLEHPHIIQVLDFGLEGNTPFLVLTYAPYGSIRQRYPKGTALPMANIVPYTKELANALQYAHAQNLIHCDVKPENILIGRNETLLLSDFGVAVVSQHLPHRRRDEISGTVAYMAPEQLRGAPCPASDQYGLGVVVYEWISGSRPFTGSSTAIAMQHLHTTPPSLCERIPTLSPAIEYVVMRALAKDPQQRFACVEDFAKALEQANESAPASTTDTIEVRSETQGHASHNIQEKAFPQAVLPQSIWHVPYPRNPHFTGRANMLERIHALLQNSKQSAQPALAITGMGGIGKTQTLIEYAYRYKSEYAAVLWVKADTHETLFADFVAIAHELHLVDNSEQEQQNILNAMKLWLTMHTDWLLVLDNIEDFSLIHRFVPSTGPRHILLTTRSQATGTYAQGIELEKMTLEEGSKFLLQRSKLIEFCIAADFIEARDICKLMDGLPLALDQAGAYIEETGCTLYQYVTLFRKQRGTLLNRRGEYSSLHPESVTATVLLALEKVEQFSPAAVELLKLCAFLHVDGIHEEIISNREANTGLPLPPGDSGTLDMLIVALRKYSLVYRSADDRTLSLHRLVQVVVKDNMKPDEQREWARRAILLLSQAFPAGDKVATWPHCARCMPHVYICLQHIEQWQLIMPEAASLLDQAGLYLVHHGQYVQAIRVLQMALHIQETAAGAEEKSVLIDILNNLASAYLYQGEYAQVEPLFSRVLEACKELYGAVHTDVAIALNNLALLHHKRGMYAQAEGCLKKALTIWEQLHEEEHPDLARTFNNLALLYHSQGRLREAEQFYQRGLAIWEHVHGPSHPDLAVHLNNLAVLYYSQRNYARAEPLFQRTLEIREKTLGPDHPIVAHSLIYLARSYQCQWRYVEAELLFKQALKIRKYSLGPEHPETAHSLCTLAKLYLAQGKYAQAELLYQQALSIREQTLGPDHPDVANLLKNYAILLMSMKRREEAVQLAVRAKAIHASQSQ